MGIEPGGCRALPRMADALWCIVEPMRWQGRRVVIPLLVVGGGAGVRGRQPLGSLGGLCIWSDLGVCAVLVAILFKASASLAP